jgi:hypothetical protein
VEEAVVTVCIAVSGAEIVGKIIQEQRGCKRTIQGGQNSYRVENSRKDTG